MNRYTVESIADGETVYYFLRCADDMSIVTAPSKYLKHKTKSNRSPNTVKRIAFSLSYYLSYLEELNLTLSDVYDMKYDRQHEHFTDFLLWLRRGSHMAETVDKAIQLGIQKEAAVSFLCGHIFNLSSNFLGYLEGRPPVSDACKVAIGLGNKLVLRDDWKKIWEDEMLHKVIHTMLHPDAEDAIRFEMPDNPAIPIK